MGIISYAQNFEDVMLWRALGHVKNGYYIDIGAQDPLVDSVSLAFYEQKWSGLHVEPTPRYAELLRQQRPGDEVIQAAVGNYPVLTRFYEIPNTGISTADSNIAEQHRQRGFDVTEILVTTVTLAEVFSAAKQTEIHWLKIDVEGFEEQVLLSWNQSASRPWVVVVESTLPLTQIDTSARWEQIIVSKKYHPVYFDGLNRYYVSDEHQELDISFASPPNVFDGFMLNGTANSTLHELIKKRYQAYFEEIISQNRKDTQQLVEDKERLHTAVQALAATYHEDLNRHKSVESQLQAEVTDAKIEIEQLRRTSQKNEYELNWNLVREQKNSADEKYQSIKAYLEQYRLLQMQYEEDKRAAENELRDLRNKITVLRETEAQKEQELRASQAAQLEQLRYQNELTSTKLAKKLNDRDARLQQTEIELQIRKEALGEQIQHLHVELQNTTHAAQMESQRLAFQLNNQQNENTRLMADAELLRLELQTNILKNTSTIELLRQTLEQTRREITMARQSIFHKPLSMIRQTLSAPVSKNQSTNSPPSVDKSDNISNTEFATQTDSKLHVSCLNLVAENSGRPPTRSTKLPNMHIHPLNLSELLSCDGEHFIQGAYQALLGRPTDPEGYAYYLGRLQAGHTKKQIVVQLALSKEGKTYAATFPGLEQAVRHYKLTRIPLFGWFYSFIDPAQSNRHTDRRVRSIEYKIRQGHDENKSQFNQLELIISDLQKIILQQTQSIVLDLGGVPNSTLTHNLNKILNPQLSDRVEKLPKRTRLIYSQLRAASAIKVSGIS